MNEVSIALVGLGGYGENYVKALLDHEKVNYSNPVKIVGTVDPFPERCSLISEITERGIPVYATLEEFYRNNNADLAVISTPIHMHTKHIIYCLNRGSNVLCEKPLCSDYQDVYKLINAEKSSGRFVGIGYQLSYSNVIQEMKKDIQSGLFGKAKQFKSLAFYPRDDKYYKRNNWAGKIKSSDGSLVLDSPVHNANAHQLHNMFYILGETRETSAIPLYVTAELYKANVDIQNYDTAALRCITEEGVEILFYATHATYERVSPISSFIFDKATILIDSEDEEDFIVYFNDGTVKDYRQIPRYDRIKKLWDAVEAVRKYEKMACGIVASASQVLCMNGAQESMTDIATLPESMIIREKENDSIKTFLPGLKDVLMRCYNSARLPSELSIPWSKAGAEINLRNYRGYSGNRIV